MSVQTRSLEFQTRGSGDIIEITEDVATVVAGSEVRNGIVTLFTPSATSALTTLEYEPGCVSDLQRLFDEIANPDRPYAHNARWGDGNGHSHVRAALLGPSLTVPFADGVLLLGAWQRIVFVDFDNRTRQRRLVLQIMGE
jgi:secondary thiamine-phosphate synthase enzyme